MKQTLYGVLVLSVSGGILLQLFPKNSRMMPYVRFLIALVMLMMLLSPLISLLSHLQISDVTALIPEDTEIPDGENFWVSSVTDAAVMRIQTSLHALICSTFGIPAADVDTALTTHTAYEEGEATVTVTAVTVTLHNRAHRIAAEKIVSLVEKTVLCSCTVMVSEEEHA